MSDSGELLEVYWGSGFRVSDHEGSESLYCRIDVVPESGKLIQWRYDNFCDGSGMAIEMVLDRSLADPGGGETEVIAESCDGRGRQRHRRNPGRNAGWSGQRPRRSSRQPRVRYRAARGRSGAGTN